MAKESPRLAPITPASGRMISLDTGKQAYSAKIRRKMAAMPYWSTKDSINVISILKSHKKLFHYMRAVPEVFTAPFVWGAVLTKVFVIGIMKVYAYLQK